METGPKEVRELSERYERLETLISRVNVNSLREEHERQVRGKAVGVDGVTKGEYGAKLEENLENLIERMK